MNRKKKTKREVSALASFLYLFVKLYKAQLLPKYCDFSRALNAVNMVIYCAHTNTSMRSKLHFAPSLHRSAGSGRRAGRGRGRRRPAKGRGLAEREGAGRDPAEPGGAQRGQTRPDRHRKTHFQITAAVRVSPPRSSGGRWGGWEVG